MLDAHCNHGNNNNTPFSRTIQVNRYQNATIWILMELRTMEVVLITGAKEVVHITGAKDDGGGADNWS